MSNRDRSLLGVVLVLVVAVGGWFLLVQPKRNQADQLQTQITTARGALLQAEASVQAGLAAEAEYKKYVKQLKSIQTAVPTDDQVPELIDQLQAASTKSRIGFQTVSLSSSSAPTASAAGAGATTTSTFPSEQFALTFTGNYFKVADVLGIFERYVRADNKHFDATGRLLTLSMISLTPLHTGSVTAAVTATDYDVPTALIGAPATTSGSGATP